MAEKRPLCHYSGNVEELKSTDTLPGAGGDVAAVIHAADAKDTLHDNDEFGVVDTEAANVLKKHTWTKLKAGIKAYLDTLTNWISSAMLRNSSACSVIGRGANSSGVPADIAAGTNDHVLRRSGDVLAFGTLAAGSLASDAVETAKIKDLNVTAGKLASDAVETAKIKDANVTLAKMANMATASLLGRNTAGAGVPEVLSAATVLTLLNTRSVVSCLKTTGNQTWTSDTVLAGVVEMVLPVAANKSIIYEFWAWVNVNATPDISFAVTHPASTTNIKNQVRLNGESGFVTGDSTRMDIPCATGLYLAKITGCCTTGASAGNIQLKAAQRLSSGTTITLYVSSGGFAIQF